MASNQFQVTLPSNVEGRDQNNAGEYETSLAATLEMPGQWEVAIMDISYPHTWLNLNKEYHVGILTFYGGNDPVEERSPIIGTENTFGLCKAMRDLESEKSLKVPAPSMRSLHIYNYHPYIMKNLFSIIPGQYNLHSLLEKLQMEIRKVGVGLGRTTVEFIPLTNRIRISNNMRSFIIATYQDRSLLKVLGFNKQTKNNKNKVYLDDQQKVTSVPNVEYIKIEGALDSELPPLLKPIKNIFVYTDIIDYVFVGNTKTPLLGYFPIQSNWGDQAHWTFNPAYYVRVNQDNIRSIAIKLCDDMGKVISFESGNVICRLHFRRV